MEACGWFMEMIVVFKHFPTLDSIWRVAKNRGKSAESPCAGTPNMQILHSVYETQCHPVVGEEDGNSWRGKCLCSVCEEGDPSQLIKVGRPGDHLVCEDCREGILGADFGVDGTPPAFLRSSKQNKVCPPQTLFVRISTR